MKRILKLSFALLLALQATVATADVPDGYYNSLEGLSGVQLKKAAKNRVQSHTVISYGDDTWEAFKTTDVRTVNGQLVYWDMYSNNNVPVTGGKPDSGVMNIEHSVANSWWNGTKNDAYKDLFHLNPSNSEANNRKGNYPLGKISSVTWNNGVTYVGKPASGSCGGASYVYEPIDEYKGDFARAFMYIFTIYDNIGWKSDWDWMYDSSSELLLRQWAWELLIEWSKLDPVSEKEVARNEAIYKIQRNRNPFIDCPELAEHIWGSKKNEPFHFTGAYVPDPDDPGTDPGPGTDPDPDDPNVDPAPLPGGLWYAVTSQADLNDADSYIVVSVKGNYVMSSTFESKYLTVAGTVDIDTSGDVDCIARVPEDAAVVTLHKVSGGYALGVSDTSGEFVGYIKSTSAKSLSLTQNPSDTGCAASITTGATKTDLSYGNAGKLLYNEQAPRFVTYTSDQCDVRLYRFVKEETPEPDDPSVDPVDPDAGLGTGLDDNADEVLVGIYDINGRAVSADSVGLLEPGLYIVITNHSVRKVLVSK